jgi:hypothetical protein
MAERPPLLAVLIDADNISAKYAEAMFDEIASLGEASIRRIYGDFAGAGRRAGRRTSSPAWPSCRTSSSPTPPARTRATSRW